MSGFIEFPESNPVRIVLKEMEGLNTKDPKNNFWHEISDPVGMIYYQKWNQSDTISFQYNSSFNTNFVELVRMFDHQVIVSDFEAESMEFQDNVSMQFQDQIHMTFQGSEDSVSQRVKVNASYNVYEAEIPLTGITKGKYYIKVRGSHPDGKEYLAYSEPLDISPNHKRTILIKYFNNEGPFSGIDYRSGIINQFRIYADFMLPMDENEEEHLISSETELTKLSDRNIDIYLLQIYEDVPAWIVRKLNRILQHDSITINDLECMGRDKIRFDYVGKIGTGWIQSPSVPVPLKSTDSFNRYDSGSRVLFS